MNEDAQQDSSGSTPRGKGAQQQSLGAFFSVKKSKASSNVAANAAKVQWREVGGTWIGKWGDPAPSAKFAAFDFDYTLVCVKGRGRFPRNSDDWRFFHAEVPQVLRRMHQQGYRIVIISNQNGLKPGKKDVGMSKKAVEYREKIAKVAKQLDVPFTILAAIAKDYMRKPSPGMWRLAELDNGGIAVDASSSFYVGDAAGRPAGWKPGVEADFSDSDLAFALNAGVSFYTPEEVFTEEICAKAEPLPLPAARTWTANRFTPKLLTPDHDS
ncbi:DNA kinase/phosphatase Pnk1, partial [Coemansia sp. Cherry 401B]